MIHSFHNGLQSLHLRMDFSSLAGLWMVAYRVESGNQNEEILGNTESEAISAFFKNCSCRTNVSLGTVIQVGDLYFSTKNMAKIHGYSLRKTFGHLRLVIPPE